MQQHPQLTPGVEKAQGPPEKNLTSQQRAMWQLCGLAAALRFFCRAIAIQVLPRRMRLQDAVVSGAPRSRYVSIHVFLEVLLSCSSVCNAATAGSSWHACRTLPGQERCVETGPNAGPPHRGIDDGAQHFSCIRQFSWVECA